MDDDNGSAPQVLGLCEQKTTTTPEEEVVVVIDNIMPGDDGMSMSSVDHLHHRTEGSVISNISSSLVNKTEGGSDEQGSPIPIRKSSTPDEETTTSEEITITDRVSFAHDVFSVSDYLPISTYMLVSQDVLFGRGGLTNHHIGNLRYRDIIELHRRDYIHASKTEKPNVARRIVKAIRTGPNSGRFLRKDEHGKWQVVDDREATWKASQALREKTRWASMKKCKERAFALSDAMMSSFMKEAADSVTTNDARKPKRRCAINKEAEVGEEPKDEGNCGANPNNNLIKRARSETTESVESVESSVTTDDNLHTTVPPMENLVGEKRNIDDCITYCIIPKDDDILFGRGGRTNHHPGNVRLREIVEQYRHIYARKFMNPKEIEDSIAFVPCSL